MRTKQIPALISFLITTLKKNVSKQTFYNQFLHIHPNNKCPKYEIDTNPVTEQILLQDKNFAKQ